MYFSNVLGLNLQLTFSRIIKFIYIVLILKAKRELGRLCANSNCHVILLWEVALYVYIDILLH